ncbi:hypothetical protein Tco_0795183 [Tanacetum coccineum]
MIKSLTEHAMFSSVQQRTNHKDFQNCLLACFLSQEEPKKVIQALKDISWIKSMQDELLQLKLEKVWTLVDLPNGKRAIGTKWVYRNKKDERGFEDPNFSDRVYIVEKALYGLHQAPRAWYDTFSTYLLDNSSMGELTFFLGLQVKQKEDAIFISQDKYVTEILKKFGFSDVKTASTPMETHKPLLKDADGEDVDEHLYRSMIGSLMYLTSSRPDIMYLKGQPKLGLWYPKDLPLDLVAFTDSDYAGASLDVKSTTGGSSTQEHGGLEHD